MGRTCEINSRFGENIHFTGASKFELTIKHHVWASVSFHVSISLSKAQYDTSFQLLDFSFSSQCRHLLLKKLIVEPIHRSILIKQVHRYVELDGMMLLSFSKTGFDSNLYFTYFISLCMLYALSAVSDACSDNSLK